MKSHMNYTMLCDFYELTMGNGYFQSGMADQICYFDVFFRNVPDGGGFAIAAGLEQIIDYIENLCFDEEDIAYLRKKGVFCEEFLEYLRNFRFTGDIWAVPEGTPIFPREPILTVRAPAIEAQFIETYLLLNLNHQSLIATKSNRIVRSAQGRPVSEFGSRRAQGTDGALLGARASYIAGCAGTACTLADELYGSPAGGTMAHSWVQMFPDEYTAFKTYCELYPHSATLLVDTYNVLKSGVPNAIRAFKEVLLPKGITNCAIRLDSGDLTYLSCKARQMLDEAGLTECKIVASNSLDEYIIRDLLLQGAKIDSFGVGERLITSKSEPVFGGVYKLAAVEDGEGHIIPKIKISENPAKITNPHFKKVYRLVSRYSGKALADLITLYDETVDDSRPLELFDPDATWKRKTFTDFEAKELLVPIFRNGKLVYQSPTITEMRAYCAAQIDLLWDEVKRFENPHNYYVDLSQKLWDIKQALLKEQGRE
ncbi:nicotinate phosphoribosyltransferase [Pseudoflavonifractor sp. DSM 107456]|uniref:Nicotinate phosphoribosyltransferase n=1 Tax=Pseudoflavonifractor gallinarum TaxID=2779352 RepID=A0ABR9RE22_9FIRM|nr:MULTISPECIES: nicotinate phosphoribosyltransferase [Pseudoflavonifractor]MBE5056959.1 nicotinate phosphoribosyltransferase [Pseudoflavonifractor gallinarum]MBS5134917.1 nicotinate phosphoribosyltransferase [Oscillospiraceae bacterium]